MYKLFMSLSAACALGTQLYAQPFNTAVQYNDYIVGEQTAVVDKNLSYVTNSVHNTNFLEVEQKRQECVLRIEEALDKMKKLEGFKGDDDLRDEARKVMDNYLSCFKIDFAQVNELAKTREESYEAMENYFKAEEKANEKLKKASEQFGKAQAKFAERNGIRLVEQKSERDDMLSKIGAVMAYQRKLFLPYFRVSKALGVFFDAQDKKDAKDAEAARLKALEAAEQGISELKTIGAYEADRSLYNKTKEVLLAAKNFSNRHAPAIIDVLKTPDSKLTQQQINAYNTAIDEYNRDYVVSANGFNEITNEFLRRNVPKIQGAVRQ